MIKFAHSAQGLVKLMRERGRGGEGERERQREIQKERERATDGKRKRETLIERSSDRDKGRGRVNWTGKGNSTLSCEQRAVVFSLVLNECEAITA